MKIHRHWIVFLFYILFFLGVCVSLIIIGIYREPIIKILGESLYYTILSIYSLLALSFIFLEWISDEFDMIIVTESRIISIEQISVFHHTLRESALESIQEVQAVSTGILESLFGYGKISIRSASHDSDMKLLYAPTPLETSQKIDILIQAHKRKV